MVKKLRKGVICFLLILLFLFFLIFSYQLIYRNKIFPGVKINYLDLKGKTKEEFLNILKEFKEKIDQDGLIFEGENRFEKKKKISVSPMIISTDPDLTREILRFDLEKTVEKAFQFGRRGNIFKRIEEQIETLILSQNIKLNHQINKEEFIKILKSNFKDLEKASEDAKLKIKEGKIEVISEKIGYVFDYDKAIEELERNLNSLEDKEIVLNLKIDYPKIKKEDTQELVKRVEEILGLKPELKYEKKSWKIEKEFSKWLELSSNGILELNFNGEKVKEFLESIAKDIEIEPRNAKFEMKEGKVIEFQTSQEGTKIDYETTLENLREIINQKKELIEIEVKRIKPEITIENVNKFGIKELVGVGKSNFAGSPENRRKNIKIGASILNGILIKPEEEFSLVKAIGEVNEKTGFLPELVIKGDRTIPEFGGGLCQLGTTTFRVVLDAGLPILERQPHSYRVVYYEPAGMDATIYNPKPDLKFKNDYSSHLLFQTKIIGNELIFEFYGTKDGRKVEISKPRIFNITKPGPRKIIETPDLPPGEKKCIERAHDGADAEFTRTVTYLNNEIKKEVWKSYYKPWQEVCLVGKKKEEGETPTSPEQ